MKFKDTMEKRGKLQGTKSGKSSKKSLAWPVTKVKSKEAVTEKAQKEGRTVHFATLMDLRYLKNSALGQHFWKYKERATLREHGSRSMVRSMLSPDYVVAQDKQATLYPLSPKAEYKALPHC